MSKDLPSIDDFGADENLPSIEDFITEEKVEELPSVEDFIEKEEEVIEEATQTIEDADGNSFAEVKDIVPPWPELVRMINDVRADIPDIPEVKYYDQELQDLAEQISKLPEVRYYDREVEAICEQIDAVREQVKDLPEVKYYDEQVDAIEDRIDSLQTDVANLPEVKYYDAEIEAICEAIDQVKASIPKFPKWVNEVNEVPDFSWIGKTFSVIDDDFVKVSDKIEGLRGKVDFELEQLSEALETKHFNNKVKIESDVKDLDEKVNTRIDEEKEKIWKELRSSSLKIWEHHKTFKDDDRKLKKQILGEYNNLKKNIDKELKEINYTSVKTDELLLKYFTELKEEISELPEVKYYDKDIDYVKTDIKDLYKLVEDIKSSQKKLQEEQQLLSETNVQFGEDPPDTSNQDPLTPIDQNFVTLDQLQQHYKIFVQRVQYQLSSIGGGGAGFIKDLDDVDISGLADGYILQYDAASSKWLTVVNNAGAGGTWATTSAGIHTTKNVGIATTARSDFALYVEGNQYVDGNITVGGTVTYEDVKNVDSLGIVTARTGIDVLAGGINAVGVVTATSFVGDGSQLSNIISGVGIQSGSTRIGTGFTDFNFTGAGVSSIVGAGNTVTIDIPATTIRRQVETASGITTDFTITNGYTAGFIDVFLNGVKQRNVTDFTASDGTTVTMTPHVNDGDVLEFQIYENLTIASQNNPTGAGGTWAVDSVGINTTKNVGIGTTASSSFDLIVNNTVSIGNTYTYPEYITGGMVPRAIKSQGGYERTLRFVDHQTETEASQDPSDYIEYTQELANSGTWKRLGITTSGNSGRDNDWWGETNPNYDNTKGLFGGLTNPAGVEHFFDFDDNTAFNNAKTTGSLKYTQAVGSFSLKDCQVGDLVLARFDLNIMPMVTNTTVEIALIYANRNSGDTITNEFALTHTPLAYGSGTVGKGFLLRPTISAYIANDQDINSRSLLAIKADNPVLINPIGVLFTIQR